jgi:hypothetical protein
MGAGKQRWWSWAVTGSPHRCSPELASLADRSQGSAVGCFLHYCSTRPSRSDRGSADADVAGIGLCRQRPWLSLRRRRCARLAVWSTGQACGSWIVGDGTVRGHDRCPIGFRSSLSTRGTCDNERLFVARYCRFRCHTSIENAQELVTRSGLSRRRSRVPARSLPLAPWVLPWRRA